MNKKELIALVAKKTGKSLAETKISLDGVLDSITETVLKGESVTLIGFGSFVIRESKARNGVNPSTNTPMLIPAKRIVKFKPGTKLTFSIK